MYAVAPDDIEAERSTLFDLAQQPTCYSTNKYWRLPHEHATSPKYCVIAQHFAGFDILSTHHVSTCVDLSVMP